MQKKARINIKQKKRIKEHENTKALQMSREPSVEELLTRLVKIHVEESQLIQQLRHARIREAERQRSAEDTAIALTAQQLNGDIWVGCRVEILNTARTVAVRDKQGTVYRITNTRVCFTTDNGDNKWRAYKNLKILRSTETDC